ncbi:MAG: type II secretion system protein GspG [bacterium]
MKKILAGGGLVLVAVFASYFVFSPTSKDTTKSLTVNDVQGDVKVKTKSGNMKSVTAGDSIDVGTEITTNDGHIDLGLNKKAALRLDKRSSLEIKQSTLDKSGKSEKQKLKMKLKSGDVIGKLKDIKNREVELKVGGAAGIAGVRGTEFAVSQNIDRSMDVYVKQGKVAISPHGTDDRKQLTGGQQGKMRLNSPVVSIQEINDVYKHDLLQKVNMVNFDVVVEASKKLISASDQRTIMRGLDQYKARNGRYPERLGQAINGTTDPWGNKYNYVVINNGQDYQLSSSGPDGKRNTSDDIRLH